MWATRLTGIDSNATTYTYDANGQRVRKSTGSNFTEYVYFGGEPIAEKDQSGNWTDYIFAGGKRIAMATGTTSSGTTYFHSDNLGSQRLMTDSSGAAVTGTDRTYLPFGWEWNATTAGSHYKFTGKERDTETGNDYFGARYYNSSMGRWLSPDWSAAPAPIPYADMSDPQSLNLYGYVRNRPTFSVDGDGHQLAVPFVPILPLPGLPPSQGLSQEQVGQLVSNVGYGIEKLVDNAKQVYIDQAAKLTQTILVNTVTPVLKLVTPPKVSTSSTETQVTPKADAHGNSFDTTKPTRGYTLRDVDTGEVLKYGETTRGTDRYSKEYLKEHNAEMNFEASGTKREMRRWEKDQINKYKAEHNGQRPPLNKVDR